MDVDDSRAPDPVVYVLCSLWAWLVFLISSLFIFLSIEFVALWL